MELFSEQTVREIRKLGKKVFLVSGRSAMLDRGYLQKMYSFLRHQGMAVCVFDKIPPEPGDDIVEIGAHKLKENGCEVIVALGGGSVIDAAKAISILAENKGGVYDYKNTTHFENLPLPVFAVPTTFSGSEVTKYAVITNRQPREKFTIKSDEIIPKAFILAEEVLSFLPDEQFIATGLDTITHLTEVVLFNMDSKPKSVKRSLDASESFFLNFQEGLETREVGKLRILFKASNSGGRVINDERTGLPHTLGNKIAGYTQVSHGVINAIILPIALEYLEMKMWADPIFESREEIFERFLRENRMYDTSLSKSFTKFFSRFGTRLELSEKNVFTEDVKRSIVEQTCNDKTLFRITPKNITREDIKAILHKIIS